MFANLVVKKFIRLVHQIFMKCQLPAYIKQEDDEQIYGD